VSDEATGSPVHRFEVIATVVRFLLSWRPKVASPVVSAVARGSS
jgi:hypothetical protein